MYEESEISPPYEITAIKSAANSILHFASDINEIYQLETKTIRPNPEYFSIKSLLHDIQITVISNLMKTKIPFEVIVEQDQIIKYQDPGLIRKIIINLIRSIIIEQEVEKIHLSAEIDGSTLPSNLLVAINYKSKKPIKIQSLNIFDNQSNSMNYPFNSTGLSVAISFKLSQLLRGSLKLHHLKDNHYQYILTLPQTPRSLTTQPITLTQQITTNSARADSVQQLIPPTCQLNIYTHEEKMLTQFSQNNTVLTLLDSQAKKFNIWRFLEEHHFQRLPIHPILLFQEIAPDQFHSLYLPYYLAKPIHFDWLLKIVKALDTHSGQRPILIVEDNEGLLLALSSILRRNGYKTIPCNSPQQALERANNSPPEIFIVDLFLEEYTGLELFQKIRELPQCVNSPVLLLTGHSLQKNENDITPYLLKALENKIYSSENMAEQVNYFLSLKKNLL